MSENRRANPGTFLPPLIGAVLVLIAVDLQRRYMRTAPHDAAVYHEQLRRAADQIPLYSGDWMGTNTPVPPAAIEILHPNVIIARRYQNIATGQEVQFLLVQVQDARDILGHYPPVCYRGQGWTQDSAQAVELDSSDDLRVNATRYGFSSTRGSRDTSIVVDNFLVLPDGSTCPDMDAVDGAAQDNRTKFFGAAQVQVVYEPRVPEEARERLLRTFVDLSRPLLERMRKRS
jgi:hypothetical protein